MKEIIIDGFAGGGGASTGIEWALGQPVDVAVNHDPSAIIMHLFNHPQTRHYCCDIWEVDPVQACQGKPVGLAWFSPDCTHHSKARGGKPVEKKIRGLAWVVVRWVRKVRPRVICLENVEEFADWGPLDKNNKPIKSRKGETFNRWKSQLEDIGYRVEWRIFSACDYGSPTIRKRLVLVARCDDEPIVWPAPTHGPGTNKPYRTAAECIDWSLPTHSIFMTQAEAKAQGLNVRRPLADNTMQRIARGLQKYVFEAEQPFIVGIDNKSAGTSSVWSGDEPLRTITKENRFALVAPYLSKYHGLQGEESRCGRVDEPIKTIDTSNRYGLVSAFLSKFYGTNIGSGLTEPVPTVTATGQHLAEIRAFLIKYYGSNIGQKLASPIHTVTSKPRFGLVTVAGVHYQIVDIGLRMLTPRELARAQGFPDSYFLTGTKSNQVAKIGNSVCPPLAEAIVKANYQVRNIRRKVA